MSIINKITFTKVAGMRICRIGRKQYRVASNSTPNNLVLLPIISIDDELMKQQAEKRLTTLRPANFKTDVSLWQEMDRRAPHKLSQNTTVII